MTVRTIEIGNDEFYVDYNDETGEILSVDMQIHEGVIQGYLIAVDLAKIPSSFTRIITEEIKKDQKSRVCK
jgi:hypothetical protein